MTGAPSRTRSEPDHRSATPPPARRPGRPLDPTLRGRIIGATRDVVADVGVPHTTISRVARQVGCGTPALRRRWPSVRHLIVEALDDLGGAAAAGATGAAADRLASCIDDAFGMPVEGSARPFVRTLLFAAADDRRMAAELDRVLLGPLHERLRAELQRAADAGELRPGTDIDAVADVLHGAMLGSILTGRPLARSALSVTLAAPVAPINDDKPGGSYGHGARWDPPTPAVAHRPAA